MVVLWQDLGGVVSTGVEGVKAGTLFVTGRELDRLLMCMCVYVCMLSTSDHSQDSVTQLLSDSNSLQDVFLDPTSSQDSSQKVDSGKCSLFSDDTNPQIKEGATEDPGNHLFCFLQCLCVFYKGHLLLSNRNHYEKIHEINSTFDIQFSCCSSQ